jgi:hypothetical protein
MARLSLEMREIPMKGIRFYKELKNKNRKSEESLGTVVAVFYESHWISNGKILFDAIGGVFSQANSPVTSIGVAQLYLTENCRRISEKRAREVHPALFEYLDD